MTLSVHVLDTVSVVDLVAKVKHLFGHVRNWVQTHSEHIVEQVFPSMAESRAPPTLGINVVEVIDMREALGG